MKDELIKFETAKLAKEKGFNVQCSQGYFRHGTKESFTPLLLWAESEPEKPCFGFAPTQSLLQKWLRDEKKINVEVSQNFTPTSEKDFGYGLSITSPCDDLTNLKWICTDQTGVWYKRYENALEYGLVEALKLIP